MINTKVGKVQTMSNIDWLPRSSTNGAGNDEAKQDYNKGNISYLTNHRVIGTQKVIRKIGPL